MAESQWGPKPFVKPPPSVFPAPAFWGPAEVPDQVRGQPRVDSWVNKDYSWEAPARDSVQAGPHDSWVAPVIKQHFFSEPGDGGHGTEGNFRAGAREQGPGERSSFLAPVIESSNPSAPGEGSKNTEGSNQAGYREQEGGDHETWVAPIIDQSFPSAPGEGSQDTEGNSRAGAREQEGGAHDSFVAPVLESSNPSAPGEGEHTTEGNFIAQHRRQSGDAHDSFVAPVLKQFFPSAPGIGSKTTEGTFMANSRAQEGTGANPLNPFVRIQAAGDAETWTDPVIEQSFLSKPGEGDRYGGENDTWRDDVIKQFFPSAPGVGSKDTEGRWRAEGRIQGAGVAESFVGGLVRTQGVGEGSKKKLDKYLGSWNFEAEIDLIPGKLNFLTITNVNSESEAIEFKFGTDAFKRYLPGVEKFGEVEMTRIHQIGSDALWEWRQRVEDGFIDVRNINIRLKHVDNETVAFSMTLHDCWPFKWDAPEMNAGGSEGAIEKISFKVARVTKEVGAPGLLGQIAGFISSLIR